MRDRKSDAHMQVVPAGPGMVRHHRNEDKGDNRPENLEVKPRAEHTADHNRARSLSRLRKSLTMHTRGEKLY